MARICIPPLLSIGPVVAVEDCAATWPFPTIRLGQQSIEHRRKGLILCSGYRNKKRSIHVGHRSRIVALVETVGEALDHHREQTGGRTRNRESSDH